MFFFPSCRCMVYVCVSSCISVYVGLGRAWLPMPQRDAGRLCVCVTESSSSGHAAKDGGSFPASGSEVGTLGSLYMESGKYRVSGARLSGPIRLVGPDLIPCWFPL